MDCTESRPAGTHGRTAAAACKLAIARPAGGGIVQCSKSCQQRDREAMTAAASASRIVEKTGQPSFDRCQEAVAAAERLLHLARAGVRKAVEAAGGLDAAQAAAHGLAWLATYVEALRQMLGWARRLEAEGRLGEIERLLLDRRLRRVPGADRRRHPDEPGRDRAARRARRAARRASAASRTQVGDLIDAGTGRRPQGAARRADRGAARPSPPSATPASTRR